MALVFISLFGCFENFGVLHVGAAHVVPELRAVKVDAPLQADGVLDEPFWATAPVTTDLIDQRTGTPAEQQTLIRVAYTRTHLYVAVECLDNEISTLHAAERREDRVFQGDDWVEIHLDPMHTHRSKYAFFANPLGTRADANEGPSGVFNYGWTAEWDLGAKILEDRWVFEMSIPFSVMNYERKDGQTWGFNITRARRSSDTTSFWSFSATEMYKPRHFGHLTGLDLADTRFDRNWEVTPYLSTRVDFDGDTDTFFQTGADVSFRLTPAMITAWTINPDFGQIEADDDTIELRDTERFLPEKRLFFREGDELMRMPHRLYYSRRFTDIDAGAKLSGNWQGFNLAFLNIQGDTTHEGTRYGNSSVLRVLQDVGERSSIAYYVADSELEHGHSRVISSDGYFFITDAWRYRFQAAGADERLLDDNGRELKEGLEYLGHSSMIYSVYPWEAALSYNAISPEFNPLLGFIPRRDLYGPSFYATYNPRSDKSWYKDLLIAYDTQFYENERGQTVLRDHGLFSRVIFPNDFGIELEQEQDFHRPYHNDRTAFGIEFFASDYWRSVELGWAGGEFEETDYHEIRLEKPWKPIERLPIRYDFTIRFEDRPTGEKETVWLNRVIFDLYLAKDMWIKSSLQHRGSGMRNISVIYGWEFRRNTYWYLVFNNLKDDGEAKNSVFTKVTYTF